MSLSVASEPLSSFSNNTSCSGYATFQYAVLTSATIVNIALNLHLCSCKLLITPFNVHSDYVRNCDMKFLISVATYDR